MRPPDCCQRETAWREARAHAALFLSGLFSCSSRGDAGTAGHSRHGWSLPREGGCTQNFLPQQFLNHEEEQSPLDLLPSFLAWWSSGSFVNTVSPAAASAPSAAFPQLLVQAPANPGTHGAGGGVL